MCCPWLTAFGWVWCSPWLTATVFSVADLHSLSRTARDEPAGPCILSGQQAFLWPTVSSLRSTSVPAAWWHPRPRADHPASPTKESGKFAWQKRASTKEAGKFAWQTECHRRRSLGVHMADRRRLARGSVIRLPAWIAVAGGAAGDAAGDTSGLHSTAPDSSSRAFWSDGFSGAFHHANAAGR